ncbi:MAG: hypothetical protein ACRD3J_07260 [Thermoanaerobaculia bacterium]
MPRTLAKDAEIVANYWYVIDDRSFIFSLRAMVYVVEGTEEQKLAFLASRAYLDYMVARPFPIPARFSTKFIEPGKQATYPVIHHDAAMELGGIDQLFFDALDEMQSGFPAQTELAVPESPLIRITALFGDADGRIVPVDALNSEVERE